MVSYIQLQMDRPALTHEADVDNVTVRASGCLNQPRHCSTQQKKYGRGGKYHEITFLTTHTKIRLLLNPALPSSNA